jgi:hypothetical protein
MARFLGPASFDDAPYVIIQTANAAHIIRWTDWSYALPDSRDEFIVILDVGERKLARKYLSCSQKLRSVS